MPLGKASEIRFAAVRPASTVATNGVLWLNPLLDPVDTLLIYEIPHPPRRTVVGASWNAAPIRGCRLFQSALKGERERPFWFANPIPPIALKPGNFVWSIFDVIG